MGLPIHRLGTLIIVRFFKRKAPYTINFFKIKVSLLISMSAIDRLKKLMIDEIDHIDDWSPFVMTFASRLWFTKMLQQYEIYKLAKDVPGDIIELGVHFGESYFHWARFLEIFNMGERETKVVGFDTFEGFPSINKNDVSPSNQKEEGDLAVKIGGFDCGPHTYKRLLKLIEIFEDDHFVPQKKRLELVKGDIMDTLPKYVEENPGLRISLLHLDVDLYEPTKLALELLYPLVSPGGVIILDEYGQRKFPGESAAFDEYFGANRPKLQKSSLVSNPSGWFVKDE